MTLPEPQKQSVAYMLQSQIKEYSKIMSISNEKQVINFGSCNSHENNVLITVK